ncbi:hypothetical protein CDAR_96701 [Caerostris darwini]|uniref:Uncharacterized protein n=1 Tax=Caerostris darwini TaxID=1538125 RepID=A0AAV4QUA9_9ARAC|nr:hypothetical protein CDAR_96701 [Caerostris darwini]
MCQQQCSRRRCRAPGELMKMDSEAKRRVCRFFPSDGWVCVCKNFEHFGTSRDSVIARARLSNVSISAVSKDPRVSVYSCKGSSFPEDTAEATPKHQ